MAECKRLTVMILLRLMLCCILCHVKGESSTITAEEERVGSESLKTTRTLVIGGNNATPGRFPYGQVSLFRQNKKHQCGGTVVAPDIILTAGHCKDVFDTIEIGEYDRTDPAQKGLIQTFQPVRKILHPMFEASLFRFDVLLVKLNRPIENIESIRLNSNPRVPHEASSWLTLIGWGSTNYANENEDRIFPSVLQQTWVPYVSNDVCENSAFNNKQLYKDEIFDEMLCAGRPGVDACRGDSGSPLVLQNSYYNGADLLVGLVSWGRGCGKYPGVYTRISYVFPWLRSRLCRYSTDPPPYLECRPEELSPALQASASPSASPVMPPLSFGGVSSAEEATEAKNDPGREESDPISEQEESNTPDFLRKEDIMASISAGPNHFTSMFCLVLSLTFLPLLWLWG